MACQTVQYDLRYNQQRTETGTYSGAEGRTPSGIRKGTCRQTPDSYQKSTRGNRPGVA